MASDTASGLPAELVDHLSEVKSWVRWQWLLRGFGRVGLLVSVSLGIVFLLDFRLDLNATARLAALWSIGVATSIALLGWIVIPICRRMGWNELAALADKAHPEWEDSLTSAVELFDPSQTDGFKGSPVMRQMLLEQTQQRVEEIDLERVVSSRRAWRSVKLGLAACLLLAAPVFFAPSSYRQLWQRLLMPSGNWGTVGAWQIEVADGDRVVARGADVELLVKVTKPGATEPPKSLLLEWRDSVGTTDRRSMPYDAARQSFATIVPHVMRDLKFHVSIERQQSRDYQVQVVEPPVITQVRVEIEPPAYSGWPAQSLDGAVGAIRVFERSRLKFTLEFNKPLESASLLWREAGEPLKFDLAADKQSASVELIADPKVIGPYSFAIADSHKLTNNDLVPRELIVVADEPPQLIVKGDQSTEVRPDDVVPIDVTATDDIGVGQLELHFEINKGETQKLIAENVQGQKEVERRFTLDLRSLKLEQGQWLTYKIRTTDERPDPEPHEVWSDVRVLRISTKAPPPGFNELAKTQEELRQDLKQLQNDIVQRQRDIEAQRKQSEVAERSKKEPLSTERLQQLEQQITELKQRGEKLADQLAADPLFHELGEQVREVAEQQLLDASKEVKQAQQDTGREQIDELRRGEQQLADAAKKLQQIEKPFQQLAELQKDLLELNRLARQADQLANRADDLNREQAANEPREEQKPADAQNADPQEKANQQAESAEQAQKLADDEKQLAKDQSKLADALNDLLKRRPELLNAAKRDELDRLAQLAEQVKELAEQQRELSETLRQQQKAAAERNGELAEKQQDLQKRAEAVVDKTAAAKPSGDEPKADKPATPEALQDAVAALKQGDLAEAQKLQQQAANELERLAAELQQAKANQSPLAQAARDLANEQKKLADKATEAQKSDNVEQRQQAAEQLQRDQAALNERIENLPANNGNKPADAAKNNPADANADKPNSDAKSADAEAKPNPAQAVRQEAEKRAEQAQQALADGDLAKAAQEQRAAEQALRDLAKQAAAQPMSEAQANRGNDAPMPNGDAPQDNAKPNEANRDPAAQQLAQLAEEQRQLAQEVAQARNEQRGEQPQPNAAQPPAANEQANARNANEQPMPANGQQPAGEDSKPNQERVDEVGKNKKEEPVRNDEDPTEVLTVRLFDEKRQPLDIGNYAKELRLDELLIRDDVLGKYDYENPSFETLNNGIRQVIWNSSGSSKLFGVLPTKEDLVAEVVDGRAASGMYLDLEHRLPGHEGRRLHYVLYSVKRTFAEPRKPPLATLSSDLNPMGREFYVSLPVEWPLLKKLAQELKEEQLAKEPPGATQAEKEVAVALRIRDELRGFKYMPLSAVKDDNEKAINVDDFVRRKKAGHCECFSDALTWMLRAVDIPARSVGGFKGGKYEPRDFNNRTGYLVVRKQDAHAWVEAYLDGHWLILDATPGSGGDTPGQKPVGGNGESQVAQQAQDARAAQRELTEQAQAFQKQVEQELGLASAEANQAQATAEQAQASQRQANSGQFDKAAESGEQAGKSGEKLAEQLQNNPRAKPELAQQAAELAEQQQAVAQKMEKLAQEPGAKNAAQQQRQQELNNAAGELGKQLAESQSKLGQQPLNLPQQAEGAKQAGQQAANSQQSMQAAQQASQQGNANQAAQSAEQAAENLQQAAQQAQAAAERNRPPQSPIPRGIGEEIAKASERLRQASEAQSDAKKSDQTSAQEKDQQGQGEQGKEQGEGKGQGEGQQGKSEGEGKGQSQGQGAPSSAEGQTAEGRPFAQAARLLREAARALADAAQQSAPQPSQGGQPQPGQPSSDPDGNQQLAQAGGGGNGQGSVEQDRGENLSDLPAQVKKVTGRNWGQLSSKLQTELTQAAKHQAHGDYSKLIKLYFQEIAKTQGSAAPDKKP